MTAPVTTQARLDHVAPFFIVRDIAPAIAFYRDRLGFDVALQTIHFVLASLLLALGADTAAGQTSEASGASARIKKVSRPMVWQPGPEGSQVPLWPESLAIQRPESDKPAEVGNGSRLVAGRPWNWASSVSRPTMTIYRPSFEGEPFPSAVRRAATRPSPWPTCPATSPCG